MTLVRNIRLFNEIYIKQVVNDLEYCKLGDYLDFIQGPNQTRISKQYDLKEVGFYDNVAFSNDFFFKEENQSNIDHIIYDNEDMVYTGDVLISNSTQLATMVSEANAGKLFSNNFIKVIFKDNFINKYYFIYLFNAYDDIKIQKEREMQGSSSLQRIPIKAFSDMKIPMIPLDQQKIIGESYVQMMKMKNKLNLYTELLEKFVCSVLEENIKETK